MGVERVVVVGAGIGGLAGALDLASRGCRVTLLERSGHAGGKMREVRVGQRLMDAGPTVFTMRWVFDALFDELGTNLETELDLEQVDILARHAWSESEQLDLFADFERTKDAIARFSGVAEARRFERFSEQARKVYETAEPAFICAPRPGIVDLFRSGGLKGFTDLRHIKPYDRLWKLLGNYFHDPRLRQLFARYATYCGSSPFQSPATLMLVTHVEQQGVWLVKGGMAQLARRMALLAEKMGVEICYDSEVTELQYSGGHISGVVTTDGERYDAGAVLLNADPASLAAGFFGSKARSALPPVLPRARSLSAVTWNLLTETSGFPLVRHNVFFSADYAAEFEDILRRRKLPAAPTVYVCAQDRGGLDSGEPSTAECLLCLVNAPADGDSRVFGQQEIEDCEAATFRLLERCGLQLQRDPELTRLTTPTDFNELFPGSGGALYGQALHGWWATFRRPGARSRIPGLYLAGGSVHPGPGVPMAALSGRIAAASIMQDQLRGPRHSLLARIKVRSQPELRLRPKTDPEP